MPCDSGMSSGSYSGHDPVARAEVERLTRVSCNIMSGLLGAGVPLTNFSEETQKWWAQHQAVDAERQRREVAAQQVAQARAAALAKLTPEEQHLLGLGRRA